MLFSIQEGGLGLYYTRLWRTRHSLL